MLRRPPLQQKQPLWWYGAATGGDDAHCLNCGFAFGHPSGDLGCRLRGRKVAFRGCCIDWRNRETNESPRDAQIERQRRSVRQLEALQEANAEGRAEAWEIINGRPAPIKGGVSA
jgi:hypothetical protein